MDCVFFIDEAIIGHGVYTSLDYVHNRNGAFLKRSLLIARSPPREWSSDGAKIDRVDEIGRIQNMRSPVKRQKYGRD
jgi:hypothetical protein